MQAKPPTPFTIIDHDGIDEWFAQRRTKVTATDVARLAQSPGAARTIRAEKDGKTTFTGTRSTDWGHQREEPIANWVQLFIDGRLHHNDNIVVSTRDDRWAATPDMMTDDGDILAEIKTSMHPWTPGNAPKRYLDQVQWQMMVTDATSCFLVCEPCIDIDGMLVPGDIFAEEIMPDAGRQAELVAIAEAFLDGDDIVAQGVATELSELARQDIDLSRRIADLRDEQSALREAMAEVIGDDPASVDVGFATVTMTRSSTTRRFDQKQFRADHPDMTDAYTTETTRPGTLRITAARTEKDEEHDNG